MTVTLSPQTGENVLVACPVPTRFASYRFGFVLTETALYVPVSKSFLALSEPLESRRIPLGNIQQVALRPASRITGCTIPLAGIFLFLAYMSWVGARDGGSSWNMLGLAVCLYALPLVRHVLGSSGRHLLTIVTDDQTLTFGPEPTDAIRSETKAALLATQLEFVRACRLVGIPVDAPATDPTIP